VTKAGVAGSLTDLLHRITGQVNLELVLDISVRFITYSNKRAQRALGRSPKEKVKCHSGAIYRGPLLLSTKYW